MESLSSYDVGKKSFEGRSYEKDIWAAREAMDALLTPMYEYNKAAKKGKHKQYKPEMHLLLGNHEARINRVINEDRKLDGLISIDDLPYQDWQVHGFLDVLVLDGIAFSHYFTSGVMGRPVSSAKAMITKKMMSCVMGHVQDRDIAYARKADGSSVTGIFGGIYYPHDEGYLNPQTNRSWRGIWVFNEVNNGSFDELPVSLTYLKEKYGK